MRQEEREESASRSGAITYLRKPSPTNTSGCCPRDCSLWHVITGATHCLCLHCCSVACATSHCATPRLHASSEAFPALFAFLAADESSWTGLHVDWIAVSRSGWRFTRRAGLSDVQSHWVEACIHFTAGFTHIHTLFFFFCCHPLDLFNGLVGTVSESTLSFNSMDPLVKQGLVL